MATKSADGEWVSSADYDEVWAALEAEIEARETFEAEAETLRPFQARAEELGAKLRGTTHRGAFDKVADELGIKKDVRDDLFKLSGWDTGADEPDPKAMRKHFETFVESRKWALGDDDGGGGSGSKEKPLASEEDAGRGPGGPPRANKFRVKPTDVADPDWMRVNQDRFAEASADGSLEYV